ncbi:MAG: phosphatase PAP2 family protein [Nitrosopumilus sp.]|nr:MAG: PA-phosphatase like protein phosphoesterase [Marine Group I thaumarchaeote]
MQNWIFDFRSRSFVLLVTAFVIVSLLVYFEITVEFDQSAILYFDSISGNSVLDLFMQSITEIGGIFYTLIFAIALILIKRTRRIGITMMILIVVSTILAGYIKCGVDRDRPDIEFSGYPFPIPIEPDTFSLFCEGSFNASFPSGHTTRAVIFGIILGYVLSDRFPRGCYLLLLYPLLMSISRVYILQHYPMDVIGGAILGIFLAGVLAQKTKLYKILEKSKT